MRILIFLFAIISISCNSQSMFHNILADGEDAPLLYINAGQSNDEVGVLLVNTDLTAPYQGPFTEVQFYRQGLNNGFSSLVYNNSKTYSSPARTGTDSLQYANQFYLYPALAAALGRTSAKPLYVCSESVGDTDLATYWSSTAGGNTGYTNFVARVNACKADLLALYGKSPRVIFCLFDQGEKDGRDATKAANYAARLQDFVDNLRIDINEPDLKFIFPLIKLGSITGSPNPVGLGGTINLAKNTVAAGDPTRIITQDANFSEPSTDGVHFTAAGQLAKNTGVGGNAGAQRMSQIQVLKDAGWIPGTPNSAPPSGQSYFNGTYNYTHFGDILDTLWTSATGSWRMGLTVWNPPVYTSRSLITKFATTSGQRCFATFLNSSVITFNYYRLGDGTMTRSITWSGLTGLYDGNEHTIEFRYDGNIATNNGLDRVSLYIDGALYTTGKTLASSPGTLGTGLFNSTAQLAVGALIKSDGLKDVTSFVMGGWAKDFFIQDRFGNYIINCPDLSTGTDTSGNSLNGTFVD